MQELLLLALFGALSPVSVTKADSVIEQEKKKKPDQKAKPSIKPAAVKSPPAGPVVAQTKAKSPEAQKKGDENKEESATEGTSSVDGESVQAEHSQDSHEEQGGASESQTESREDEGGKQEGGIVASNDFNISDDKEETGTGSIFDAGTFEATEGVKPEAAPEKQGDAE